VSVLDTAPVATATVSVVFYMPASALSPNLLECAIPLIIQSLSVLISFLSQTTG
jgi:hypothetical protein